ncbi:hypothetical protein NYY93_25440, partial [Acinetobacter baumannii]|nr:hypothetical protein [Acinetobacter baumannii]
MQEEEKRIDTKINPLSKALASSHLLFLNEEDLLAMDLLKKQPTAENSMEHSRIQPTLQGDYGDLNQEIPQLYIEGLKEFLLR